VPDDLPLVTGEVWVSPRVSAFREATLRVRLEETGRADARARVVAEAVVPGVSHSPQEGRRARIPFALRGSQGTHIVDPRGRYTVRAWFEGGERTGPAGYLGSDRAYPVLTHGFGSHVIVRIERAGEGS